MLQEKYKSSKTIEIREKFAQIQKTTSIFILALVGISLAYLIFWLGAISDEVFLGYGKPYFEPLASFLNLGSTDVDIYLNTCIMSFCAIIPTVFLQVILSKTEESLLKQEAIKEEKKWLREQKEAKENYNNRFDSIKTYSICLSVDYESEREISIQNKQTLNKGVFSKLSSVLLSIEPNATITQNNVFIFSSTVFSKYDIVYDTILNQLSQISTILNTKYNYKLIPSMTTDAFSRVFDIQDIAKQHFEIQTFNFKNRALSTAAFANKYKHLKHNKYAGIPIGEYAYFKNEKTDTYELNVIHKNLVKILTQS